MTWIGFACACPARVMLYFLSFHLLPFYAFYNSTVTFRFICRPVR